MVSESCGQPGNFMCSCDDGEFFTVHVPAPDGTTSLVCGKYM